MAYIQKNNPFKSSPCKNCGSSPLHQPKISGDIDWDNLTDEQKRAMNLQPEVDVARYGVDVTRYKVGSPNMPPGHIQASITNPQSQKVREDLNIKRGDKTWVNPWETGNLPVYPHTKLKKGERYKDRPDYETQRIYLKEDQAKEFLQVAKTIKPTKEKGKLKIDIPGMESQYIDLKVDLPIGKEGYDFIRNNCAKGVCESLGIDPSEAKRKSKMGKLGVGGMVLDTLINKVMTDGGITEPKKAWDIVMKKFGVDKT